MSAPEFIMVGGRRLNCLWGPADNLKDEVFIDRELGRLQQMGISCQTRKFAGKTYLYRSTRGWAYENPEDKPKKNVPLVSWQSLMTECKRGHKLSGENLRIEKNGYRTCLTCEKIRDAEKYRKKKLGEQAMNMEMEAA